MHLPLCRSVAQRILHAMSKQRAAFIKAAGRRCSYASQELWNVAPWTQRLCTTIGRHHYSSAWEGRFDRFTGKGTPSRLSSSAASEMTCSSTASDGSRLSIASTVPIWGWKAGSAPYFLYRLVRR
jgi:hypothetical protein